MHILKLDSFLHQLTILNLTWHVMRDIQKHEKIIKFSLFKLFSLIFCVLSLSLKTTHSMHKTHIGYVNI